MVYEHEELPNNVSFVLYTMVTIVLTSSHQLTVSTLMPLSCSESAYGVRGRIGPRQSLLVVPVTYHGERLV